MHVRIRGGSVFRRLIGLLAAVTISVGGLSLVITNLAMVDVAAQHAARSLATQILAADAMLASPAGIEDARFAALGIRHVTVAPPEPSFQWPFLRNVTRRLEALHPGRDVHFGGQGQPAMWARAVAPAQGWVGIPMAPLVQTVRGATIWTLVTGALIIVGAAGFYARGLTRPLRLLARHAPDIAAGADPPPLPRRVPREMAQLEHALRQAAADVRAVARERELMLAALSHDLRTPLARLRLALALSDVQGELREGMDADLDELDQLTGQFVDFVRDGRDEPAEALDAAELVRSVAGSPRRTGTWQVTTPDTLPLRAKPLALRRALENLLQNAERHGRAPFEVRLSTSGDCAELVVRDHGAGVDAALLPRLGEPFLRADPARSGAGSGLGLASARRVAQQHGGTMTIDNAQGGGLRVRMVLPLGGH
ncbi:ATP-binding protein [Tahibacter amnicola]|uniref:histidine kinase n=1 Tax=Tahibacter amnicola TaxID=2976241 RepID=A0ABY6BLH1_9GAMM|nr:ATP-binding protein [Tahibacter amnicola]UXI69890.1 ATP-binding protein [Tahibacter amnicola]